MRAVCRRTPAGAGARGAAGRDHAAPVRVHRPPRGRRLLRAGGRLGRRRHVHDQFIHLTEGVIAREDLRRTSARSAAVVGPARSGRRAGADAARAAARRACGSRCPPTIAWSSSSTPTASRCGSRSTGTGARRSTSSASAPATAPTSIRSGATSSSAPTAATPGPTARRRCSPRAGSRRATARRCRGCNSSRGYGAWIRTDANGTQFDLSGERVTRLDPRRRRAAAGDLFCAADAGGAAARVLPADRLPGGAARVGLRVLEEP